MMFFRVLVGLVLLAYVIYIFFCFLEVFGFIKFTEKNTEITFPKALIPFYYIVKTEKKVEEPVEIKKEVIVEETTPKKKTTRKKKTEV